MIAIAATLAYLNRLQPLANWLIWRFAGIWGLVIFFGLACLGSGHALLVWPCRNGNLFTRERLLLDMAAGVLVFALGTFLLGIARGLGGPYFWAFPSTLLLLSAPWWWRESLDGLSSLLHDSSRLRVTTSPMVTLATVLGTVGLALVYLPVLVPQTIAFDARWYHLAIAEHYAAAGRIAAFPEGWFLGSLPHLASWLYTWALTSPILDLHGRLALASHIEFLLFLWTLAAVPTLVIRITGAKHARGTWVFFFLFPGLFLCDSNLATAADHVLAFWAIPMALAALWFVTEFTAKRATVLAIVCAGALLTKLQAIYLLAPTVLFVFGCGFLRVMARKLSPLRFAWIVTGPFLGCFLLASASYWLTNAIWYHNPVYPMLGGIFPSRPWRGLLPGTLFDSGWAPVGSLGTRIGKTLLSPFYFAFIPHDWLFFHRDLPAFGLLFTFALLFLPVLRKSRPIWILTCGIFLGIMIWYWTYHQDRYLQALLPWMAAVTAAVFISAWAVGPPARIALTALVVLQLVWGGDVPFLPAAHLDGKRTSIEPAIRLLSSTYRNDVRGRFDTDTGFDRVALVLPSDSVVLLHLRQLRLGIGRPVVTDNPRWTGGALLGSLEGPAAAWRQLRDWGVTHMLLGGDHCVPGDLNLQSELATHYLAEFAHESIEVVDEKTIVKLSKREPTLLAYPDVVYAGCSRRARIAWHSLDEAYFADRSSPAKPTIEPVPIDPQMFEGVDCAIVDERCPIAPPDNPLAGSWKWVTTWRNVQLWMRRVR
jgi:hypothetical protein